MDNSHVRGSVEPMNKPICEWNYCSTINKIRLRGYSLYYHMILRWDLLNLVKWNLFPYDGCVSGQYLIVYHVHGISKAIFESCAHLKFFSFYLFAHYVESYI